MSRKVADLVMASAVEIIEAGINSRSGTHASIEDAINQAWKKTIATGLFVSDARTRRRINRAIDAACFNPATRRRHDYGKTSSESGNKFAIKAVKENGRARVKALARAWFIVKSTWTKWYVQEVEKNIGFNLVRDKAETGPTSPHHKCRGKIQG